LREYSVPYRSPKCRTRVHPSGIAAGEEDLRGRRVGVATEGCQSGDDPGSVGDAGLNQCEIGEDHVAAGGDDGHQTILVEPVIAGAFGSVHREAHRRLEPEGIGHGLGPLFAGETVGVQKDDLGPETRGVGSAVGVNGAEQGNEGTLNSVDVPRRNRMSLVTSSPATSRERRLRGRGVHR